MEKSVKDRLFDKTLLETKNFDIPEDVFDGIENGKYNSHVGLSTIQTISVGDEYTLNGLRAREMYKRPACITDSEWNKFSENEKHMRGHKIEWLEFVTAQGGITLGTVLGDPGMRNPDFWKGKNADWEDSCVDKDNDKITVVAEDGFDCSKVFMPTVRVPALWVKRGLDGLATKTIRCVAIRTRVFVSIRTGEKMSIRTRAFIVK